MEQAGEIAVQFILVLAVLSFFLCGLLVAIGRIFMQRLTAEWVGRGLGIAISITLAASISWVYYVDIQSYSGPATLGEVFPKLIGPYLVPGYLLALNFLCIPMIYWMDKRKAVAL